MTPEAVAIINLVANVGIPAAARLIEILRDGKLPTAAQWEELKTMNRTWTVERYEAPPGN